MEELPLEIKIIGVAICFATIILLAAHDKVLGWLKRSMRSPKAK